MARVRVPGSLTIVLVIIFTLLVIIYHILSNEVDDISSGKVDVRLKVEDIYPLSPFTDSAKDIARRQRLEAEILENVRNKVNSNALKYERNYKDNIPLFQGQKIVHLDLKGAPPTIKYYRYLFPLLKKLGATGILVEYEDMFPFTGEIKNISALNCYTHQEIVEIQRLAEDNDLEVIPLIQTFGHFEFVLKLDKYKDMREVSHYPQALCPSHNRTLPLLYEMLQQVIDAHPTIKNFHIGADEVYQLGECSRCLERMARHQWEKKQLFLSHVAKVANYIKKKYPSLTILMWDDEFREISPQEIIDRGLDKLVEPVVWKYTTDPQSTLTELLWDNYARIWPNSIWIATAFKGATAPDRYYTDISYHIKNHEGWLGIIARYSHRIKFKGALLTGWQRYDHFSVLCELLPSSIPSLAISLAVLQSPDMNLFPPYLPSHIKDILSCESMIALNVPEPQFAWTKCDFHGSMIYAATLRLFTLSQEIAKMEQENTYKGWLKEYNLKHAFSSPSHVEHAVARLGEHKMEILYIENEMRTAMEGIFDNYTIDEWIETHTDPLSEKITKLWEAKERILERDNWPRRPLPKNEL
ncbi:hexosaminidase D-like [Athalia rosae]|uniref:hexosaminidase D-like n=1 Tax=Athalia rosae TaxID=37344 RepID=UPI0020347AC4|nr:hexosaminidase D-like [Athalia rosae]